MATRTEVFIVAVLFGSFAGGAAAGPDVGNVVVQKIGADTPDAFCKDFSLTSAQVKEFFRLGKEVDTKEFHDEYEYLPCFVDGTLSLNNKSCTFSIRAGGTAEVDCKDEQGRLFGCADKCDHLLGGGQ